VTTIEAGAFTGTSLTTVLVPIDATVASGAFESAVVLNYVDFATNLVYPPAAKTSKNTINGYNGTVPAIVALPSSVLTVKTGTFTGSALTTLRHNIFTTVESGAIETGVSRQYIHYATNFVYEDSGFTTLVTYNGTVPSSLSISASVTTIRANAFANNAQLTSVTIPSSVTSIEAGAFSATGLSLARVPVNCSVASGAFDVAATLQYVDYDTNFIYSDAAKTTLVAYNAAIPSALTIPSGVTTIPAALFSGATTLNSVSIPASVTSMGTAVFSGCTFLGSATVDAQLTTMPASTFMNCPFLSNVTLPTTLVTIGSQAFRNTGFGSVDLPNVLDIQAQAFFNNTAISSITARKVSTIATDAFTGCTSLEEYPAEGSRLLISGTTVTGYSGTLNGTLTIPDGIVSIGTNAFNTATTRPTDTLRGVNLPNTLTTININAFNRTTLRSITFPNSITTIGQFAFNSISTMSSLTLPNANVSIGNSAFTNMTGLTTVTVPPNLRQIGPGTAIFSGSSTLTTLILQNGISSIAANTFTNCHSLRSFDIPSSLAQIGNNAFTFTNLSSVTAPQTLSSIGQFAFSNCRNLTSLTLPYNQIAIGDNAFASTSMQTVTIPGGWSSIPSIFVYCRRLESVDIQGPVTSVGSYAFFATAISSFSSPTTLTTINGNAFQGCVNLSTLTLGNVANINGGSAFQGCTALQSIVIPASYSVTNATTSNFAGCTSLGSVSYMNNTATLAQGMFAGCTSLSTLTFANVDTLSTIGARALQNTRITSFNGPNVSTISSLAFANNTSLTSVSVPNATFIAADAFTGCTALAVIPLAVGTALAPTGLSATAGNGTATITFTAGANGGSAITNYAYSIDNGATFTPFSPAQTTSPVTITGLTNGTTYNIQLRAINATGDGVASSSVSVSLPALKQLQADWAVGIFPTHGGANTGLRQHSATKDASGNIYVTGGYSSSQVITLAHRSGSGQTPSSVTLPVSVNTTYQDAYIIKYNSDGIVQWATTIRGTNTTTNSDIGYGIAVDSTNNVYVTGTYRMANTTSTLPLQSASGNGQVNSSVTLPATTTPEIFLVKYNSNGIVQWATAIRGGGGSGESGYGLAVDSTNSVYVTGWYNAANTTTTVTLQDASGNTQTNSAITLPPAAASGLDAFLVKYNSSGIVQWATAIRGNSGSNSDIGWGIAVDSTNSVYITGQYRTISGSLTLQNALLSADASGNWQTNSTILLPGMSGTSTEIFLVKYNSSGVVQWATAIRGNSTTTSDIGFGLAVDSTNSVYITGQYRMADTTTPLTLQNASGNGQVNSSVRLPANVAGSTDAFLVKYNSSGVVQWATAILGTNTSGLNDYGNGIAIDALNNVYLTGAYVTDSVTPVTILSASGTSQITTSYSLPISESETTFLVKYTSAGVAKGACAFIHPAGTTTTTSRGHTCISYLDKIYVYGSYTLGGITLQEADSTGASSSSSVTLPPLTTNTSPFLIQYTASAS
jgi:hypothetical protein